MTSEKNYLTDSIEEIKKRISGVETTVNRIEALERAEIEYMRNIEKMESQELSNLDKITSMEDSELNKMDKLHPLKYPDIMLWKNAIWESCPNKIMIESKTMVLFNCKITSKVCCFTNCPRNIIKAD